MRADKLYTHTLTRTVLMTLAFFVFAGMTQSVSAATFTVNQLGDGGDGVCDATCTLRDAVDNANTSAGADTIVFATPLFDTPQTIGLTRAQLTISNPLTITGPGARLLTVRRASLVGVSNFRIFGVSGVAAVVSISDITISNGSVPDGSGGGGVINNNGTLTLNGVVVSGNNTAAAGGGIRNAFGTTTILNSTVSGNTAGDFGGGGIRVSNGTVNIANSTVSGNTATSGGGGIAVLSTLNMNNVTVTNNRTTDGNAGNAGGVRNDGTVNTRNSIIAGNFATGGGRADVAGIFASNGYNIVGSTPGNGSFTQDGDIPGASGNLDVLANNGGQTDTHRLLTGSPAIDAGNNCVVNQSCGANNPPAPLTTDQRGAGFSRQRDGDGDGSLIVDIGAFEVQTAPPLSLVVTRTDDRDNATCATGDCSLREAVNAANVTVSNDTITFDSTVFAGAQTINLTIGQLTISQSVTITGRGARLLTVRRSAAAPSSRVFLIDGVIVVNISGLTVSDGNSTNGGGIRSNGATLMLDGVAVSGNTSTSDGGGIFILGGTATILNSTFSGNTVSTTAAGGGIAANSGTVNIANSTVSGNSAGSGGGISTAATLNLNNVTVTNNTATSGTSTPTGGVVIFRSAAVNTRNTVIAGNTTAGSTSPDVLGAFTSNGSNLIGNATGSTGFTQPSDKTNVAANLAPLANNGGQTDTHRLLPGSPAINAGDDCVIAQSCISNNPPAPLTTDQRGAGFPRQIGAAVDIGAFEAQLGTTAASVSVSGRVTTESGRGIRNVVVTMTDMHGNVRTTISSSFGYYRFENVAAGETYIFAARGKRFFFGQAQIHSVMEETNDINFIADGGSIRQ